jgi:hypothetical protein
MTTPQRLLPVPPEALIPVEFDFSPFAGAGVSISAIKSIAIVANNGKDIAASDRLYNAAEASGQQGVVQWLRYPVVGEVYDITCAVSLSDGREWSITGRIPCARV